MIPALKMEAAVRGVFGTPRYYAFLREGYAAIQSSMEDLRNTYRGKTPGAPADTTPPRLCVDFKSLKGKVIPLDHDPAIQAGLLDALEALPDDIGDFSKLLDEAQEEKIFGGAPPGACDHLEAVAIATNAGKLCSGLLVGRRAVLTAAHCVCSLALDQAAAGAKVYAGVSLSNPFAVTTVDTYNTRLFDAGFCMRQPKANHGLGNDLALVFLSDELRTNNSSYVCEESNTSDKIETVRPAQIAPMRIILDTNMRTGRIVGYGLTERGTRDAKLFAHVINYSRICGDAGTQKAYQCAGGREAILYDPGYRQDTCNGDSGGPVYYGVRNVSSAAGDPAIDYAAFAITSRGVPGSECGAGGIYTLINPRVVEWMRRNGVSPNVVK